MKVELTIEKNVILKRDKPWSHFYSLNDNELLCYNEHKKFESVNSTNGKIEHLSNKTIINISKASLAHCLSNNGQLCGFLSQNYEITLWNKDKLIRTIPSCSVATQAIKTTPYIFISNNGEQVILILRQPCRIFLWIKSNNSQVIPTRMHHNSPICSTLANRSTDEHGTWYEISLTNEQLNTMNDDKHQISNDVFFHSENSLIICAFVFTDQSGYIHLNRLDIDWKSTIYAEQTISYSFETIQIPINISSSSLVLIRFAHSLPILAISLSTNILFISLTSLTFSKFMPINCSLTTTSNPQQIFISDLIWSYDDQFLIGITNRGALFFLQRFGSQINLITQGECIAQGPLQFIIIHPLIGQDSEATNHLGSDSFMRSIVPFSNDDKTKQQKFSLTIHTNKPLIYCSDGYRLARITYSNKIRDRRFYDPLLYLYLLDINQQQDQQSIFIHKTRSFDDLPKTVDRLDTESIGGGGGNLHALSKYGSLTSLPIDDLPQLSLDDIFSAYHLLLTSSERVQHDICASLERTTQTILLSSDNRDILTPIQLSHCLANLVLSSTFGSLTFLHISCLTKFIPLFINIFQQQTTIVNDPELLQLCILCIIERWLQTVLYLPTKFNTFELCRRQKAIGYPHEEIKNFQLCKAVKQLELLQGTNINLDEFLSPNLPNQQQNLQVENSYYNRLTLLRSWYTLWSSIEKKIRRDKKNLSKYLTTIRLFIQSILQSFPSLNTTRLLPYGHQIDLNDLFPPILTSVDHPLNRKGYSTLNERRKQRRRISNSIEQPQSARTYRRGKPPTEARKALVLHRILYSLLEQYNIRDAICILNVALRRETSLLSSCLPLDLFSSNLFQYIDTRTYFGMPGHALRSVLRTLARFMARSMITNDNNNNQDQQLFIYSVDSACPLPNLFKTKQKSNEQMKYRIISIDRNRLNLAIEQQKLSKFWQPLKVLELFILGQSPNEAVFFAKLAGDWRTALCLASVLPPHNGLYDSPKPTNRSSQIYSPFNTITVDALLYTKLCEYLQIDNLKSILKRSYKQDEILSFIKNLSSTLEQFLLCSTLLQVPLTEMLLKRLNAIMIYLFTLIPIFISSKYYLPCPPIYSSILNTYDDEKYDITCKYETHIRLIYYRTIHIFIQLLSASRIQLSCLKWYLDYLTVTNNNRRNKQQTSTSNDSFHSIKILLKSLRFHKLPNIPDRILIYFRDFCIILFLLDTRDRLSLTIRNYIRNKTELIDTSDKLSWQIISYATILLSFRCLISDEMNLLRIVLNLFFDLTPSEQLMRALATLIISRQYGDNDTDNNAEILLIVEKLKAKWMQINPQYIRLYEEFLETIIIQDVQGDIITHYLNDMSDQHHHQEPIFDFKPKWFETCVEYGEFMTMLIPLLLDTSSLTNIKKQELNNDHTKYDSTSIPLVQTMSAQLRELELPTSLDKRYLLKQTPLFVPPHEYVVFPVRILPNDTQQTMFQQTPTNVNNMTIGSLVQTPLTQQPPGVVSLEKQHRRNVYNFDNANNNNTNNIESNTNENPSTEWDGRSDDPSRSHVRQFDEPYSDAARRSIWMAGWANRGFSTTTDQTQTAGMRISTSAQFLAASSLISDQQRYEMIVKQHEQQNRYNNDQADNDTDLTDVTKNDDEDGIGIHSELASSPRRRDLSFRKNSLDESMSLPIFSNDGNGDFGRSRDFRALSRETGGDETPTYDLRDFPNEYREFNNQQPIYHQQASPLPQMSPPTSNGFQQQQQQPVRQSFSDRRFLDDSDPYLASRLEQEERNKYIIPDTNRTITSIQSPHGHYPPSLQDPPSRQSPTRDPYSRRSPTRESHRRRSPTRDPYSHRSSSRDRQQYHHHQQQQQQPFPQIQQQPVYDQVRVPAPIQYTSSLRLPLLRLGGPVMTSAPMFTQSRFPTPPQPPPPVTVYPTGPVYVSSAPRPAYPIPMLHLAPQLPPPVSLTPQATRADQQKLAYVQNIMHQFTDHNRPRLQLLQMRPHPRTHTNNDLQIPMPAPNIVSTSSDTKVDAGIQAEVPRQDGFIIEPGLFQSLLRDATGVNFTSAEAHYSAARQIQQQVLEARRRERSTMTDLPAHQVLYDLQYGRGGDGDERKFVNVTDIAGTHADALLAQIERDQAEREQLRQRQLQQQQQQQQQYQQIPPPIPMNNNMNEMPPAVYPIGFDRQHDQVIQQQQQQPYYPLGFDQQHAQVLQQQQQQPYYPLGFDQQNMQVAQQPNGFYNADDLQHKSELILQRRRQREQEEKQAEQLAFGNGNGGHSQRRVSYEPNIQTYESDENDFPLEYLIRQPRSTEPVSDASSRIVDPISVRSTTPRSPRKQVSNERRISIKTTTPRDPFSPRRTVSHTSAHSTAGTPRKAASPTIADRHREARQRQQQILSRARDENALRFADAVLHGESVPQTHTLDEFQLEALESSFTSTVVELARADGLINRTYDLDLNDNDDDIGSGYSARLPSRPMSANTSNYNQNASHYSTSSSQLPRPSSASSTRSRPMTPMGKAIVQAKQKGPPPARSNMARKRPVSSPANLGHKRGSIPASSKNNQTHAKLVRNIRKASPPSHKPTTYNQRVRALNSTYTETQLTTKSDPSDPKALMRLYGTRRVPGLYVPYEKTEPRVTKTYSERMQELQQPVPVQPQKQRQPQRQQEPELEQRPSSAPSSSISLSDWEVDDRVKQLLADDQDTSINRKLSRTITPLGSLDELDIDDDNMDETTYSLTRVTETNENTYGADLQLLQHPRFSGAHTNTYGGTRASARSSAGGDMTARDESELSKGESSLASYIDWSLIDKDFPTGTQ
ncbi:unnamed protein product [Adineta steineri]|uniref:Uncharacterized protein n=3 Tax=Adineta steineri TaxID=433720 RepID=A0A819FCT7_9BILA|nr:unnamed protein product [Adineta steineri]